MHVQLAERGIAFEHLDGCVVIQVRNEGIGADALQAVGAAIGREQPGRGKGSKDDGHAADKDG